MSTEVIFTPTQRTGPGPFSVNDCADFEQFIAGQLRNWIGTERKEIESYLRRSPGHTVRDWKGKGDPDFLPPSERSECDWNQLPRDDVREIATINIARDLPANVRQAAARDPALIWNPLARRYRFRQSDDPVHGRGQ
jgi:hypothetical protein